MADKRIRYMQKSSAAIVKENKNYTIYDQIPFIVKDPIPDNISLDVIIKTLESYLPSKFAQNVDSIYMGQFEELSQREITSVWKDGAIFVDNEQDSVDDIVEDLIHEIAHATEDAFQFEIYSDDHIEYEFLLKRRHLYDILLSHDVEELPTQDVFMSLGYNDQFDEYLHKTVGYERLTWMTMGLFASPYGATSVREYFANGFEEYFSPDGDRTELKMISPAVYNKIEQLMDL